MSGGWRFFLGLAWGAVAMLVAVGSAHAQGGGGGDAPAPQQDEDADGRGVGRGFTGRLSVYLNGAYQVTIRRYETPIAFQAYGEQAKFLTREEFRGGAHVDIGGAVRVWRELAVGVTYTQLSNSGAAVVTGTVPHPFNAGRDRTSPAQTLALAHQQRAAHVHASWRRPLSDTLEVTISVGPTYFNLRQGGVARLTPSEVGGPSFH